MKCFKRTKDNVAASTITIKNEVEMDEKKKKDEIPLETAHDLVGKSLELFDCPLLKNIKPDRTLRTGKKKINKVTNAFSKAIAIALDEPTPGQSIDCLNCCWLVELIKKKLGITEDRGEIIQLLTISPYDLSISKVAEVFNISEYTARQAHKLRLQKGIFLMSEWKQRVGISQETKQIVLVFYESEEITRLLPGKKDYFSIRLLDKQRWRNRNNFFYVTCQRFMRSLKRKTLTGKLAFQHLLS